MKGLTVKVEKDILDWITSKVQSNLKKDTYEMLNNWRTGQKEPTFNQIESISRQLNIPLGYFFLKTPPQEKYELIEYRTVDSLYLNNPSRNLLDTIDAMTRVQDWMKDYLIQAGYEGLTFVGKYKENVSSFEIARDIRSMLELDIDWYKQCKTTKEAFGILRDRLQDIGILVMMNGVVGANNNRSLDINEFRAFALVDQYAPLIFINTRDSDNGKVFSLLHEAVHVWVGENSLYNERVSGAESTNKLEVLCNAVAAEILVPISEFRLAFNENLEYVEAISILTKKFRCSKSVIARRALECKYITNNQYWDIVEQNKREYEEWIVEKAKNKSSGGSYYNTARSRLDKRFMAAIYNSVREGKTQYTEAYRLTNTSRTSFERVALGGEG